MNRDGKMALIGAAALALSLAACEGPRDNDDQKEQGPGGGAPRDPGGKPVQH